MHHVQNVVVRFPPSPTGFIHVGNVRTLLFNYCFAKQTGGRIIFRSEDTDRARSTRAYEDANIAALKWLGLSWDEFYRQSERTELYQTHLKALVSRGVAYISEEESKMHPGERATVVRLKNPNIRITFKDEIRGDISFDTTELGDIVLARSVDDPVYHFCVVLDDHLMGVTHVIRGEDHISNTPRQILIQEALDIPRPVYAHLPIILGTDRTKLSKRHGSVSLQHFKDRGFLPEALINYLGLLGWNDGSNRELYSLDELVHAFSFSGIQRSGAIFSEEKLGWFNAQYLKKLEPTAQQNYLKTYTNYRSHALIIDVVCDNSALLDDMIARITNFDDLTSILKEGEYDFIGTPPRYPKEMLLWKKQPDAARAHAHLTHVRDTLISLTSWDITSIRAAIMPYAEQMGKGNVLWPMRVALSGREKSPDPVIIASSLGKDDVIARLEYALSLLR